MKKTRKALIVGVLSLAVVVSSSSIFALGDVDGDGIATIADPVATLAYLFLGTPHPPGCVDSNGDGSEDIADAVLLLAWLFAGGPPPVC